MEAPCRGADTAEFSYHDKTAQMGLFAVSHAGLSEKLKIIAIYSNCINPEFEENMALSGDQ